MFYVPDEKKYKNLIYTKSFNKLIDWKQFYQQVDDGEDVVEYFQYGVGGIGRSKYVSKRNMSTNDKYNILYQPVEQREDYEIKNITYGKFNTSVLETQHNTNFYLEKSIVRTLGTYQMYTSQLFKVIDTFEEVLDTVKKDKKYEPDQIHVYVVKYDQRQGTYEDIKPAIKFFTKTTEHMEDMQYNKDLQQLHEIINGSSNKKSEIRTINSMLNQVYGLNKQDLIEILNDCDEYMWSVKLDGVRNIILIDDDDKIFKCNALEINIPNKVKHILDCEICDEDIFTFDCLMYDYVNIQQKPFKERYSLMKQLNIPKILIKPFKTGISNLSDLKIAFQQSVKIYDQVYLIDGVILTNITQSYIQTKSWKLKDKKFLTTDYLFKRVQLSQSDQQLMGGISSGDVVFEMYVGSRPENLRLMNLKHELYIKKYGPVKFAIPYYIKQPSQWCKVNLGQVKKLKKLFPHENIDDLYQQIINGRLDDCIIEVTYDDDMVPYPLRLREDKTNQYKNGGNIFGNDFRIALSNFENRLDPITEEFLDNCQDYQQYFNIKHQDGKYDNFKNFGRKSRFHVFQSCLQLLDGRQQLSIIDIGSGRNADYKKYLNANKVFCIEPDTQAVIEYYKRMQTQVKNKMPLTYLINGFINKGFDLNPVLLNFKYYQDFNLITMNYSFHYLCDSVKTIQILKQLILKFSTASQQTVIQMLYYSGPEILKLLNGKNEWSNKKYKIILDYDKQNSEIGFGKKILVSIPTISNQMSEEYLVDMQAVQNVFGESIKLHKTTKLVDVIPTDDYDNDDKEYLQLQYSTIFIVQRK